MKYPNVTPGSLAQSPQAMAADVQRCASCGRPGSKGDGAPPRAAHPPQTARASAASPADDSITIGAHGRAALSVPTLGLRLCAADSRARPATARARIGERGSAPLRVDMLTTVAAARPSTARARMSTAEAEVGEGADEHGLRTRLSLSIPQAPGLHSHAPATVPTTPRDASGWPARAAELAGGGCDTLRWASSLVSPRAEDPPSWRVSPRCAPRSGASGQRRAGAGARNAPRCCVSYSACPAVCVRPGMGWIAGCAVVAWSP